MPCISNVIIEIMKNYKSLMDRSVKCLIRVTTKAREADGSVSLFYSRLNEIGSFHLDKTVSETCRPTTTDGKRVAFIRI